MRRRYIFLVLSIILGFGIIHFGKVGTKDPQIHTIEQNIEQIKIDGDNTMEYAEDVLDGVIEQKNKISDLDGKVKDSKVTIEGQVIELERLLKQANLYKKMADENADQARLIKDVSLKQKQMAEVAQKVTEEKLNKALYTIKQLESDYKELNSKFIMTLQKIKVDTIPQPTIIKDGNRGRKNSKKKED
tara:strand:+ start:662 stop:1225 length:564 start_codon:yes stop_codon:yes gene_type:complete